MAKFLTQMSGRLREMVGLTQSAGSADANKLVQTDAGGRLDESLLPTGVGADIAMVAATESLTAGAIVNVYNASGTVSVRNADATTQGKEANAFVRTAVTSGANATVFLGGLNDAQTSLTAGARYYLATTAGAITDTPPAATDNVVQFVGTAVSATELAFEAAQPITLA